MSITMQCDANTANAVLNVHYSKPDRPIYTVTTHVGMVVNMREMNGYHDSDFLATVYEPDTDSFREICYASTRGWSYANGASVDATPEVKARWEAEIAKARDARAARAARHAAATPDKGKRVRVIKGRKVPVGTEGVVFWYGAARQFGSFPRNGYKAHGRDMRNLARALLGPDGSGDKDGYRIGFTTDAGDKYFTAATNVDVIAA
jgi:hypothetical protein